MSETDEAVPLNSNDPASLREPDSDSAEKRFVPFLDLLKVRPVDRGHGHATFEMVVEERHLRSLGLLHGGVTAALLDTTLGTATGTTVPDGHYVVTVQLNVNFIRPVEAGETVVATGRVQHSGRQTAVASGEIRTSDNTLVATGSGTFMYLPHSERERNALPPADDAANTKTESSRE